MVIKFLKLKPCFFQGTEAKDGEHPELRTPYVRLTTSVFIMFMNCIVYMQLQAFSNHAHLRWRYSGV